MIPPNTMLRLHLLMIPTKIDYMVFISCHITPLVIYSLGADRHAQIKYAYQQSTQNQFKKPDVHWLLASVHLV